MAITTYAELQTAVAGRLKRSPDADVTELISLAEARLSRDIRLQAQEQRSTAATVAGTAYYATPTDYLEARTFKLSTDPLTTLEYVDNAWIDAHWAGSQTGKPRVFTVIGQEFRLAPTPDSAYTMELLYWKTLPALSVSNTTNWLITNHPDLYLYATLIEAAIDMMDDTALPRWEALYRSRLDMLRESDRPQPSGMMSTRPVVTPA